MPVKPKPTYHLILHTLHAHGFKPWIFSALPSLMASLLTEKSSLLCVGPYTHVMCYTTSTTCSRDPLALYSVSNDFIPRSRYYLIGWCGFIHLSWNGLSNATPKSRETRSVIALTISSLPCRYYVQSACNADKPKEKVQVLPTPSWNIVNYSLLVSCAKGTANVWYNKLID